MVLEQRIMSLFAEEAGQVIIERITVGLGYTVVLLEDGRCGLCCTLLENDGRCVVNRDPEEYERKPALALLEKITTADRFSRVLAIATANALNHRLAYLCDDDNGNLLMDLQLEPGSRVAMVGHFDPVVAYFKRNNISIQIFDIGKHVGDETDFYDWARSEADAMVMTATSLINGSMEHVFDQMGGKILPTVLMGPSTIVRRELYRDLPITVCAGTVPVDIDAVERVVRNGKGTRAIHKHARKVHLFV